jgi:hypothetical protein
MTITETILNFFEGNYGGVVILFVLIMGYLLLKKYLMTKGFENRKNVYDPPEEIARLTLQSLRKKNPDMVIRFANPSIIKELVGFNMAMIENVNSDKAGRRGDRTVDTHEGRKEVHRRYLRCHKEPQSLPFPILYPT